MNLGVVGHAAEKWGRATALAAREEIRDAIKLHGADALVSGRSPMGGVDVWAEEIAAELGLAMHVHLPRRATWEGDSLPAGEPETDGRVTIVRHAGFKARNLAIAQDSDLVLVVVVRELPRGFAGMKFDDCYHCKGRNPRHAKSGGCWTAWKCAAREWRIIE